MRPDALHPLTAQPRGSLMMILQANSESEQEAVGAALAKAVPPACVIYLEGDLGAGKTTLARGFMRGLGHQGAVKSPSYTLIEPYELKDRRCFHFDLYRLADPGELEYLGVRDLLVEDAVLLVEWPDRGEGGLPPADLIVRISYRKTGRKLQLLAMSEIGEELIQKVKLDLQF